MTDTNRTAIIREALVEAHTRAWGHDYAPGVRIAVHSNLNAALAALDELERERDALRGMMKDLLAYEQEGARLKGYRDCTCAIRSREADRDYENGTCAHQIARAALKEDK